MSAVIDITSRRPRSARSTVTDPAVTDELVAELAHAVGAGRTAAGPAAPAEEHPIVVGTPDGPRPLISIQPDHRGGANDLVVVGEGNVRVRRLVIAVTSLALAIVLAVFAGLAGANADGDIEVAGTTTLQSGETLWQLADEITPAGQDVRPNLDAIMAVNDFDSAALPAGTLVLLPAVE